MKAYYRILGILFGIIVFGFFAASFILPKKTFSDLENRVLSQVPSFSYDTLIEGRYTSKIESYINDHFPLRSNFVTLKSSVDGILGKVENNGVYLGKDGYLLEEIQKPNEKHMNDNIEAINSFIEKHKDLNSSFLLVPNAATVLNDYLPKNAISEDGLKYINEFGSQLDSKIKFINPYDKLNEHKEKYIL